MFKRGWEVRSPLVSLLLAGSPSHRDDMPCTDRKDPWNDFIHCDFTHSPFLIISSTIFFVPSSFLCSLHLFQRTQNSNKTFNPLLSPFQNWIKKNFIQENASEHVIYQMAAILFDPVCYKTTTGYWPIMQIHCNSDQYVINTYHLLLGSLMWRWLWCLS